MSMIGVRELRQQASEVIRRVREEDAEYVITYQGRPVAIILPLDTERAEAEMVQAGKKAVPGVREQAGQSDQEIREAAPAYVVAERTVLELEQELVLAVQRMAYRRQTTIGEILSGLAERASALANDDTRHGIPLFPIQPDAGPVTLELVNQLRDEVP